VKGNKELSNPFTDGYTHIDDSLPKKDGMYDAIIHSGSISISYIKAKKLFREGAFPRMDWDYVIIWKKEDK